MPRREPSVSAEPVTLRPDVTDGLDGAGIAARWVGQRVLRSEDKRMITGHGQYVDDQQKPGMVHATFVRSTVARGRIAAEYRDRGLSLPVDSTEIVHA